MRRNFLVPAETLPRFQPNLTASGRLIRGLGSIALFIGGAFALRIHFTVSVVLFVGAAFLLFEALRGWCALRACGIRTRF